jgi:hypothetical protein
MGKIADIEFIESCSGIQAIKGKENILDLLEYYDLAKDRVEAKRSIITHIDQWAYRLRLAYFGRFV